VTHAEGMPCLEETTSRRSEEQWKRIEVMLSDLRDLFQLILQDCLNDASTAGTCLHAACLLKTSIENFAPGHSAIVRGGDGEGDGGCMDSAGRWRGHYWVEVAHADGRRWVADITGDQFGLAPVVWDRLPGASLRYRPGNQDVVDEHVARMIAHLESTTEDVDI